jgi:translocation and assembly module TamA
MRLTTQYSTTFVSARFTLAALLLAIASSSVAELSYEISGVTDPLLTNVRSHTQAFSIQRQSDVSDRNFDDLLSDAIQNTKKALRPYGYYHPEVAGNIVRKPDGDVTVVLRIRLGPPVVVNEVRVEITGDGANRSELKAWRDSWPLRKGQVLDQTVWEERKQFVLDAGERIGYLGARFSEHKLELDLNKNSANISLVLESGDRYLFGDTAYGEHVLKPGIVEYIPRFLAGDPYSQRLLNEFRRDLWRTGWFTDVVVKEVPRDDVVPPVVDLVVELKTETRNTYQGSVGVGSDTGLRLQAQWSRHPMSSNGDRVDVGAGWQEKDNEYSLRGSYRLPRRNKVREYWVSDLIVKHENIDFNIRPSPDEDFIRFANGSIDEQHLRIGRLKIRNFKSGEQQAFETLFVQALSASDEFSPVETEFELQLLASDPEAPGLLKGSDKAVSIGVEYDLVSVTGKAWETKGHRERGWLFGSSKSFGSDRDFMQAYVSTRRSYLKGERWKFIVRAEAGYSEAKVNPFDLVIDDRLVPLSVTTLPNFYRFKAGGSNSVRGYGFEELSNNHIGSNHLITASAEVEMKFLENWSAALFFDIGNAFNDWSAPELKKGIGVGVRWYTIAGPIRVDVAQALDLIDRPWRVHFTIGTPLF